MPSFTEIGQEMRAWYMYSNVHFSLY